MAGLPVPPRLRWSPLTAVALAWLLAPSPASAAGADLGAAVAAASGALRQAWSADPSAKALPFPNVRLLPAGAAVQATCDPKAPPSRPAATAAWCASSAEVLIDRDLLATATTKLSGPERNTVVTYWLATALAERLLPGAAGSAAAGSTTGTAGRQGGGGAEGATGDAAAKVLRTLQANCLGGVLLGASSARPNGAANPLLVAARAAYGDRYSNAVGTASQRGYALLTGLGATATASCSSEAMAALVQGNVPDPALLRKVEQLPPPERAHSSLMAAINSQCQPLPARPCPRTTASAQTHR